jgi:BlaI family transcriptional regulator, penicillinase repressor
MARDPHAGLSRRERQIMDVIYRLGQATAQEIRDHLEDPPSYSAVRAHLRVLEEKQHLRHRWDGPRYLFEPTVSRERARRSALKGVLRNFFDDSHEKLVAALLEDSAEELSDAELKKLARLIEKARKEGR